MKKSVAKTKTLKRYAWEAFSHYIRLRDCMRTTGSSDRGECVTCGKTFEFARLHAGHFVSGRNNSILFDPRCVHAQCGGCNTFRGGQQAKYYAYMFDAYGPDTIDELFRQANKTVKFSAGDYKAMRGQFKTWAEEIERGTSIYEYEFVDWLKEKIG